MLLFAGTYRGVIIVRLVVAATPALRSRPNWDLPSHVTKCGAVAVDAVKIIAIEPGVYARFILRMSIFFNRLKHVHVLPFAISNKAGIAFGAEQLLHFDGETDSGRDIYLTVSKGWWSNNTEGEFPLNIATFGFGTGKLAEGTIKGLCSDLLGGSGTEVMHKRRLCWCAPTTIRPQLVCDVNS